MYQQIQNYGQKQNHLQDLSLMFILPPTPMVGQPNGIRARVVVGRLKRSIKRKYTKNLQFITEEKVST
jgi:hypothetical protein